MKIIINRMYAGGYLNLSENMIGHEAINLVETDDIVEFFHKPYNRYFAFIEFYIRIKIVLV